MYRILSGVMAVMLIAIFAAKLAFDLSSSSQRQPTHPPWALHKMEFIAWNNEKWTAWIREEAFEQLPRNTRQWSRHSNGSLAFIDWRGDTWQAKIDGQHFLLAHRGNWDGPIIRSDAIRYRDWRGKNTLRTVNQLDR